MARMVVKASPKSGAQIEAAALNLIQKYQPGVLIQPQPFDVERFFENHLESFTGVRSMYQELYPPVHGYTDSDQMVSVVSSVLADDPNKLNFFRATVAHEIGHAVQHVPEFRRRKELLKLIHDSEDVSLRMFRKDQIRAYEDPEWQAWRFAKALLMPAVTVRMAGDAGISHNEMSLAFQVSVPFVRSRLRDLKLL
jgi:IrrE N-terminal-like domain